MPLKIIILAAGQGKRMNSDLPKVLHPLAGKPLLSHVIATAASLAPHAIMVVYGHQGEQIQASISHPGVQWVHQSEQLGTGHAVKCCLPFIDEHDQVLILAGDVPLIQAETLTALLNQAKNTELGLVTATLDNPTGLGRVIRDQQQHVIAIIEEKDATLTEKQIQEINSGIVYATGKCLHAFLPQLSQHNAQQEYYLTEIFTLAVKQEWPIATHNADAHEVRGINTLIELALVERLYQEKAANALMLSGVMLLDPARFELRGECTIGRNTIIDINVILEGHVQIGKNCRIESNVILRDVVIGDHCHIKSNSIIEQTEIAEACQVGPFARLRPGTALSQGVHIGNFVELKKAMVSDFSKINHLSYVGDTQIGKHVNIGAGTITCNYDGVNKHQTIIEDHVFIGSNTQLVAPVTVGAGATIGAGSTITKDVPPATLALSRVAQQFITGWKRPEKKEN